MYAVWTPVLPSDSRSSWEASLLDDPRVTSLWDRDLAVSRWVAAAGELGIEPFGPVVYDVFLLFSRDARWDSGPSDLLASGLPVIGETDALMRALEPLLQPS